MKKLSISLIILMVAIFIMWTGWVGLEIWKIITSQLNLMLSESIISIQNLY